MLVSAKRKKSNPLSLTDKSSSSISPLKENPRTISKRVTDIAASRVKEAMARVHKQKEDEVRRISLTVERLPTQIDFTSKQFSDMSHENENISRPKEANIGHMLE